MLWYNEPPSWEAWGNSIQVNTGPKTDFWRKTHYDFIRDSGHFYYEMVEGDFTAEVKVIGQYTDLYDQAGLMLRLDDNHWLKCGIEYVHGVQHASVVVTREFSDWSVVALPENPPEIWLRLSRQAETVQVFYSLDGQNYNLLRLCYLPPSGSAGVGPMCASPDGEGFQVTFEAFNVSK
jgi:regulation of enolase protein 1 (concanavalin A-like superfamily)